VGNRRWGEKHKAPQGLKIRHLRRGLTERRADRGAQLQQNFEAVRAAHTSSSVEEPVAIKYNRNEGRKSGKYIPR
jgi:hypothetical protein